MYEVQIPFSTKYLGLNLNSKLTQKIVHLYNVSQTKQQLQLLFVEAYQEKHGALDSIGSGVLKPPHAGHSTGEMMYYPDTIIAHLQPCTLRSFLQTVNGISKTYTNSRRFHGHFGLSQVSLNTCRFLPTLQGCFHLYIRLVDRHEGDAVPSSKYTPSSRSDLGTSSLLIQRLVDQAFNFLHL